MTSPDPTAPNEAASSRLASRTTARRVMKAAKDARNGRAGSAPVGGEVAVTRDPRATVSRAGSRSHGPTDAAETADAPATADSVGRTDSVGQTGSAAPTASAGTTGAAGATGASGRTRTQAAPAGEDILDRLAQLDDARARDGADEAVGIPVIVEADPTYPPVTRPPTSGTTPRPATHEDVFDGDPAIAGIAATIPGSLPATTLATTPVADVAAGPATTTDASATAVSADLPTGLVNAEPDLAADGGAGGGAGGAVSAVSAVGVGALGVGVIANGVPVVDRTDVVPLVVPDVVPQDLPYTSPIPMTPMPAGAEAIDESTGMTLPVRRLRAPVVFRRAKPRVRRVTRVVRHVDTWSVFKVALVFSVILYLVCLTSGVLLWNVAHATGTIDNVEKFFEQFGWESFEFKGGEIYHNAWIGGLFVAIGLTGFAVLLATLFNLITDLVGGIRVSVLEEEVVAKPRGGTDATGGGPRSSRSSRSSTTGSG